MHSQDPMHSINNVDEVMTHTRPLIPDVPFHPGPTYRAPPNLLHQTCQEVRKVHKVHLVQKILIQILVWTLSKILCYKKALILKLIIDWTNHSFQEPKKIEQSCKQW